MNFKKIKKLHKENDIHFYSYWDRKKLINLAVENNLLPDVKEDLESEPKEKKDVNYDRLKTIRKNPKEVAIQDVETDNIMYFPSVYKAAKFIDQAPQTIVYWAKRNGAWKNKYRIVMSD